jgi:hypothetical protein
MLHKKLFDCFFIHLRDFVLSAETFLTKVCLTNQRNMRMSLSCPEIIGARPDNESKARSASTQSSKLFFSFRNKNIALNTSSFADIFFFLFSYNNFLQIFFLFDSMMTFWHCMWLNPQTQRAILLMPLIQQKATEAAVTCLYLAGKIKFWWLFITFVYTHWTETNKSDASSIWRWFARLRSARYKRRDNRWGFFCFEVYTRCKLPWTMFGRRKKERKKVGEKSWWPD